MPRTELIFFQEKDGSVPVRDWLEQLQQKDRRAFAKCVDKITLLSEQGHELRRPHADMLRDGVYELRARSGTVNYRILYFFHGKNIAILAHALTKEAKVLTKDIERAIERKAAFEKDAQRHSYREEQSND